MNRILKFLLSVCLIVVTFSLFGREKTVTVNAGNQTYLLITANSCKRIQSSGAYYRYYSFSGDVRAVAVRSNNMYNVFFFSESALNYSSKYISSKNSSCDVSMSETFFDSFNNHYYYSDSFNLQYINDANIPVYDNESSIVGTAYKYTFGEGASDGKTHNTPASGQSIAVEKYLIMDQDANVPNATFSYSIAGGTAKTATENNGKQIYSGADANRISGGLPSVGTAVFTPNDTTYTSAQEMPSSTHLKMPSGKLDPVTLTNTQKYARKDITINFGNVSFNEPGIYRYVLTETASSAIGITDDSSNSRILDVYVESDSSGVLSITGYVLHKTATSYDDDKADGFINTYTTHNVTVANEVSGNQASRDKYFKFTVSISGAVAGTVYNIDLSNADAETNVNGATSQSHNNPSTLTVGQNGTISGEFWLQGEQSIIVKGLADTTTLRAVEDDYSADGYDTTYAVAP